MVKFNRLKETKNKKVFNPLKTRSVHQVKKLIISAFTLAMVATSFNVVSAAPKEKIIIAVDKAPIFSSDKSTPAAKAITTLPYGTEISSLGSTKESYIFSQKGAKRYVKKVDLSFYKPIKTKTIKIRAKKGYLFNAATIKSKVRGSFDKGTQVQAIGDNGRWYFVDFKDKSGKIRSGFIAKTVAW